MGDAGGAGSGVVGHRAEPVGRESWRRSLIRSAVLLFGTLVLATAFIAAYAGALHDPTPRDVPVGVVRSDQPARTLLAAVRQQDKALRAVEYDSRAAADKALNGRDVYAVLASTTGGGTPALTLVTASAAAPIAAQVITQIVQTAAQRGQVPLAVSDAVPIAANDQRGLVPFYLAVGLVLGGYLGATVLGITLGTTPRTLSRAGARIGGLAVYSALLGLAGALVTGPGLDVWHTHFAGLVGAGALAAFAAAMAAAAVQGWLGLLGTGLVILLLVVLGNPGSGGIYAPEFLPDFFRDMHLWNIPGLATDLVRAVVYFSSDAAAWPAATLAIWAVAGLLLLLAATAIRGEGLHSWTRRPRPHPRPQDPH
ncbi:hypothetical protein [Micromonospora sp. NBC_01796]|uniref:hypothetical protein n=1 Tax=Micromonospora sp. NBC_01796 TaxID=2975987 RepID=UPI002DDC80C8|nr:hypothetical protein [Micromonospora sp. NBC_01796]WSA87640.1 hypothetical protein OIE47_08540 [Micromonospora sp. NBC_01796]